MVWDRSPLDQLMAIIVLGLRERCELPTGVFGTPWPKLIAMHMWERIRGQFSRNTTVIPRLTITSMPIPPPPQKNLVVARFGKKCPSDVCKAESSVVQC